MNKIVMLILIVISLNTHAKFDWLRTPETNDLFFKKHLSIVFTSQNIKNPLSMFGHTFLVAHNDTPPEPDAITIEFLGKTYGDFKQYLNAFFSNIDGEFRLNTFILKKREYDFEDRNLWLYELNLTKNQKENILNSISTNIKNTNYPYIFLNKNCSFYVFNVVIENNFNSNPIYTLPKNTIRDLKKRGYITLSPTLIESDQSKLINFFKNLSKEDANKIKLILNGYSYPLTEQNWPLLEGLNLALDYKIPREPSADKRNLYFNIKKKIIETGLNNNTYYNNQLTNSDPTDNYGDGSLRLAYGIKNQSINIEGKLAQRDFYSSQNDGLSNSYLEVFKGNIFFNKLENIKVQQFTIFKIESVIPDDDYLEPFNRLIDLSYYDHAYTKNMTAKETVLRYGSGVSIKFKNITFGTIPYLGLRYFDMNSSKGIETDLGILTKINYWVTDSVFLEGSIINYYFTKLPFNFKTNLKFAMRLNKRWLASVEEIVYDHNINTEFSIVYGF